MPTNPDQGNCKPLPVKIDCEAPVLPLPSCPNEQYTTGVDPITGDFFVTAGILDQNCASVLDQNSQPIMTRIN